MSAGFAPPGAGGRAGWRLCFGITSAALVAFSLQLYMPLRSRLDPAIDENNPETWATFKSFLERKQYGRESMVSRMFRRRGLWEHQLGRHPRMGFWSFFEKQYGIKSGPVDPAGSEASGYLPPAFWLLLALGLLGAGYLAALFGRVGAPLALTLLLSTLGLVVYMNFADGTRYNPRSPDPAYLEVRDRDYFFTTGFGLFGLCVGIGVGVFMRGFLEPRARFWKPLVGVSSAVFLFALPVKTLWANYWMSDRSRDFIAYDYAHNYLHSCDPNSILFTNGDNDTFPLWCLQEAYGVRRDVRIVNLSLANTHWYVRQTRDRGVPLELTDDQIARLVPSARDGRVQDQVIDAILESNRWRHPVHFGLSVPEGSRIYRGRALDSNLQVVGLTLKLSPLTEPSRLNRALTLERYRSVFRLRGVGDTTLYMNETTRRIAENYATGLLQVADAFRRAGFPDSARVVAAEAARLRPRLAQPREYVAQLAGEHGWLMVLDSLVRGAQPADRPGLFLAFGLSAELAGRTEGAVDAYRRALELDGSREPAFRRLASIWYGAQAFDSLLALIDRWVAANPRDTLGPLLRAELVALLEAGQAPRPEEGP